MKHIAIIEKANDGGYGIYLPELKGVALYGYGLSEQEAKENLSENIEMLVEHYGDENQAIPDSLAEPVEFEYRYDVSGFFNAYPFFNVSELAERLSVNPSLLRKYKNKITFASDRQRKKIEQGIHVLANELSTVRF
jgi:predicted RNase H-like HicB family nuclease